VKAAVYEKYGAPDVLKIREVEKPVSRLKKLPLFHLGDSHHFTFCAKPISRKIKKSFDVIYDTVGKSPFFGSLKSLKDRGIYLQAVHIPPFSLVKDLWVKVSSKKTIVGGISIEKKEDLDFMRKIIEEGTFKPIIDRTFDLEDISKAHEYVEKGHKVGNVAITVHKKE